MIHGLKISPEYFDAVEQGIKPFEVRKNDRDFKVGDVLWLCEWEKRQIPDDEYERLGDEDKRACDEGRVGDYTGRETRKVITYILDAPDYCKEGYVVLGLAPVKEGSEC